MSAQTDYWADCLTEAADAGGFTLTQEQLACLAKAAEMGHENYGMAFYSPPPIERVREIEREWQNKLRAVQAKYDSYVLNADIAIKHALGLRSDDQISIGDHGEVLRHGGRTERIQ